MTIINRQLFSTIIQADVYPTRFEAFSLALYKAATDIDVVPTSRSWDHARDGRSVQAIDEVVTYLCCTTQGEWEAKVENDIRRLTESLLPGERIVIVYTMTAKVSEHAVIGLHMILPKNWARG